MSSGPAGAAAAGGQASSAASAALRASGEEPLGFGGKYPTKTRRWVREHDAQYSLYCREPAEGNPKGEQMELFANYCVEIEKVDLSDVQRTPSGPPFIPQNQTFSDYLSCNGGGDNHHGPGHYGPSPPPLQLR